MSKSPLFCLARLLHVDYQKLKNVLSIPKEDLYSAFYIGKTTGGKRLIEAPRNTDLKEIQKQILALTTTTYCRHSPKSVNGFMPKKSVVDNARPHLGKNIIIKFDIQDFFGSINYQRVAGLAKKVFHMEAGEANSFALFTTYNNHLPQGASSSPMIANMICFKLDRTFQTLSHQLKVSYTRYADDVTFSFSNPALIPFFLEPFNDFGKNNVKKHRHASAKIKQIFQDNGFTINDKKTNFITRSCRQKITGIIVNDHINLQRSFIKNIRASLYAMENGKPSDSPKVIEGKLNYLKMVVGGNNLVFAKYACTFNKIIKMSFPEANFILCKALKLPCDINDVICGVIIDSPSSVENGSCFFFKKFLITAAHVLINLKKGDYFTLIIREGDEIIKKTLIANKLFQKNDILIIEPNWPNIEKHHLHISKEMIGINETVSLFGNPDYPNTVLSPYVLTSTTTGKHRFYGSDCLLIKDNVSFPGMSGGPVLNSHYQAVGIIATGCDYLQKRGAKQEIPSNSFYPISETLISEIINLNEVGCVQK